MQVSNLYKISFIPLSPTNPYVYKFSRPISIDFQLPFEPKKFFLETQDKFLYCSFPFDVVLALLAHLVIKLRKPRTPKVFQKFFSAVGNRNKDHDSCINHKLIITAVVCSLVFSHLIGIFQVFLGVMETIILLVHFCVLVWVLFGVLSIFCITCMSFGDYSHPQYQEMTHFPYNTITFQMYF